MFRFCCRLFHGVGNEAPDDFRLQISSFFLKQTNPRIMQILSASVVTYYILALYILLKTSYYSASLANIQQTIIQRFTKTAHDI